MKAYKTLLKHASDEVIIQKSRFIGHAAPVQTVDAALAFLESIRAEHRAATHNCYAYILGENAGIMRYSDDGEPSGTAGIPILEVLKARGVVDCAVVVTRYFGGILLGTGGLVRAYSHTCALALDAAKICTMVPAQRWLCEVQYPQWDRVLYALKALPVRLEPPEFTSTVQFTFTCQVLNTQQVMAELEHVTDGRIETLLLEEIIVAWEAEATQGGKPDGHV